MSIPFINLNRQYQLLKTEIDQSLQRVLDHGQYIMGPEVEQLENELADYVGVKYALTCSSGTDALVLPLMHMKLEKDDAVFTSPFTFFASAESISLAGGTPVFVDIDPITYNILPASLEQAIEEVTLEGKLNPRGIIPIDLFGMPADYGKITKIAEKHELFVLEDAAQSFGANYKGKKTGSFGDFAATSFYPAKPLGCYGDGGAVFTDDIDIYESLMSLRVHGQGNTGDKYDNIKVGLNARMDTIQAAILLQKIKIFNSEVEARNSVAKTYTELLSDILITPEVAEGCNSVWAQYSVQSPKRDKIRAELLNNGIPTAIFYPTPVHLSTAYSYLGYKAGDFPTSESASTQIFSLPMHPYLEVKEIERVCDMIRKCVAD